MPKTKIVCTVGPSSRAPDVLESMIRAGLNVVRLNFSHGTHDDYTEIIGDIRRLARKVGRPVAILQDLAGPKIRIGTVENEPVQLREGAHFVLTSREVPGDDQQVSMSYSGLPNDVQPEDVILLADGRLRLRVLETTETDITCEVVVGGELSSRKGINLPGRYLQVPSVTEKDRADLAFGLRAGVDFVALSFVRTADDVRLAKRLIKELHGEAPLIAKIEKHEALENIDAIVAAADGVMVARGDLGVETPLESVPRMQKMIIRKCNDAGKPVITATQMLLSMMDSPTPTRAEATDIANAILDGTDAIMMSDETAVGRYPLEALETMTRIACDAEKAFPYEVWTRRYENTQDHSIGFSLCHAACHLAEDVAASCIVSFTQLGGTPRMISRHRPACKILAPTPVEKVYRRLALVWAVIPVHLDRMEETDAMVERAHRLAREFGGAEPGDKVVITGGVPAGIPGSTNTVTVCLVPEGDHEHQRSAMRTIRRRLFRGRKKA